ncbi:unnamed protein product [Rotaria sordida]|uniref:Uncharacterized protein n=1 Tax=Rotaria sordida TaxID=392033 RepID=A0A813SHR2_9BILA|nr:unnamed protein product [Rotaria sordida]CAF3900930.1 unnamed protein product [Rotaria sordida]
MATSQMKPLKNILPATTTRKLASDRIYKMCYSVHEAFGLSFNKTSSKSSFTSESSTFHPVAAVGGRRTINVQSPPVSTYFLPEMNHYLVLKSIKSQMIQNVITNDDVDDDSVNNDSELVGSLPTARSLIELIKNNHLNKSYQIQQWSNNSSLLFGIISEDVQPTDMNIDEHD